MLAVISANAHAGSRFGPGYRLEIDNRSGQEITGVDIESEFTPSEPRCLEGRCRSSWMFPFAHASEFTVKNLSIGPVDRVHPHWDVIAVFKPKSFDKGYDKLWANKCVFDVRVKAGYREALFPSQNLCAPVRLTVRDDLWRDAPSVPRAAAAPPAAAPAAASEAPRRPWNGPGWYVVYENLSGYDGIYSGPYGDTGRCTADAKQLDGHMTMFELVECKQLNRDIGRLTEDDIRYLRGLLAKP